MDIGARVICDFCFELVEVFVEQEHEFCLGFVRGDFLEFESVRVYESEGSDFFYFF